MAKPRKTLTIKQKKFVNEYIKSNGNGQQSAMKVYDTKDPNVARAIASENLTKPNVKNELNKLLKDAGYNPIQSIVALKQVQNAEHYKTSGADKIKASIELLKIARIYNDVKQTVSYNLNLDNEDTAFSFINKVDKIRSKRKG